MATLGRLEPPVTERTTGWTIGSRERGIPAGAARLTSSGLMRTTLPSTPSTRRRSGSTSTDEMTWTSRASPTTSIRSRTRRDASGTACCRPYTVDGPFDPANGFRFDREKVLLDPYARAICFPPEFDRDAARGPGSNAGRAPLGVLCCNQPDYAWDGERRPRMHGHDLVIYEAHVRGFTRDPSSGVSTDRFGTYAGLVEKIPYLKELGVTAVELMPVFQADPQEGSTWGYMTLGFFALHGEYAMSITRPRVTRTDRPTRTAGSTTPRITCSKTTAGTTAMTREPET